MIQLKLFDEKQKRITYVTPYEAKPGLASEVDHAEHFQQTNFLDMFSTQHNFHCIWNVWFIKTLLHLIINII